MKNSRNRSRSRRGGPSREDGSRQGNTQGNSPGNYSQGGSHSGNRGRGGKSRRDERGVKKDHGVQKDDRRGYQGGGPRQDGGARPNNRHRRPGRRDESGNQGASFHGAQQPGNGRHHSQDRNTGSGRQPGRRDFERHGARRARGGGPDPTEQKFFRSTVVDPWPRIRLEKGSSELTMRAMDLLCPIGMGQRGLIVAPPGSGKTTFLQHICQSLTAGYPELKVYCLLIDERPEEVTDFRRSTSAEVRWSSTDMSYENHIETADNLMKQVYREAGSGENVIVVIDSLTRLARVHNSETRGLGRTLSGGVDARAMEIPRRIFGSARKIEHGGSLTILATILVDTGSRMDQVIFEEFKGTGNMEIFLSREISSHRIYPAVKIRASGTRKEERLFDEDECQAVHKMRHVLASMGDVEAARGLIEQLKKYETNREFLDVITKTGA